AQKEKEEAERREAEELARKEAEEASGTPPPQREAPAEVVPGTERRTFDPDEEGPS
ncbi:MAG: hypothetical protein H0T15_05360, partial [Thermoleophilaceae bacterium]|nr:hypothetical protein [Thermoleophilaceae bacterium]